MIPLDYETENTSIKFCGKDISSIKTVTRKCEGKAVKPRTKLTMKIVLHINKEGM
ncbi:hypothetical protein [Intestinibacter bartlettii]|uniref:hypothetical protein n=1 Tax=Intestinibacter bartlettii TaxID=261299 RepID=UPI0039921DBB